MTCKLCKQNFNSNKELYEHIRNHEALRPAEDSHLSINALDLVCETEETSFALHKTPAQKPQEIDVQKSSIVGSPLSTDTANSTCKATEKPATASTAEASNITPAQKETELARQEVQKAEVLKAKQRLNELRERRAQREASEAAKPTPTPRDIGIFDPTLICDIQEFELYSQVTGFLQHFEQCRHQYRKSDILNLLPECLRDPAFA